MNNIIELINKGENKHVEFKVELTKNLLKTVIAFANYHNGKVIISVSDDKRIVGLKNQGEIRIQLEQSINDNIDPVPYFEIAEYMIEKKSLIVLSVYKGEFTPYTYRNKSYKRSDSSTVEIKRNEYQKLILAGRNLTFETSSSSNGEMTFLGLEKQLKIHTGLLNVDRNILITLELLKNEQFNNGASLLSDQNKIQCSVINLIKYENNNTSIILERNRVVNCSIIEQFTKAIKFYQQNISKREIIIEAIRQTTNGIPLIAYREALANAIIHRDYFHEGEIRIEFFNDRIEIVSPGSLPSELSKEEFIEGKVSILRNRIITEVFMRIGIVERMGTGIRRIKEQYKNYINKPSFQVMENSITVILPTIISSTYEQSPNHSLFKEGKSYEEMILDYLSVYGSTSRIKAQSIIGLGKTQTYEVLKKLVNKGEIIAYNSSRATRYKKS